MYEHDYIMRLVDAVPGINSQHFHHQAELPGFFMLLLPHYILNEDPDGLRIAYERMRTCLGNNPLQVVLDPTNTNLGISEPMGILQFALRKGCGPISLQIYRYLSEREATWDQDARQRPFHLLVHYVSQHDTRNLQKALRYMTREDMVGSVLYEGNKHPRGIITYALENTPNDSLLLVVRRLMEAGAHWRNDDSSFKHVSEAMIERKWPNQHQFADVWNQLLSYSTTNPMYHTDSAMLTQLLTLNRGKRRCEALRYAAKLGNAVAVKHILDTNPDIMDDDAYDDEGRFESKSNSFLLAVEKMDLGKRPWNGKWFTCLELLLPKAVKQLQLWWVGPRSCEHRRLMLDVLIKVDPDLHSEEFGLRLLDLLPHVRDKAENRNMVRKMREYGAIILEGDTEPRWILELWRADDEKEARRSKDEMQGSSNTGFLKNLSHRSRHQRR